MLYDLKPWALFPLEQRLAKSKFKAVTVAQAASLPKAAVTEDPGARDRPVL